MSVGAPYWMDLLGDIAGRRSRMLTERIERMGEDYELGRQVIGFSVADLVAPSSSARCSRENGRIDEARPMIDRAVRLAREHDDVESLGWSHNQYALLDYYSGEVRDGLEHARAGVEIAERIAQRVLARRPPTACSASPTSRAASGSRRSRSRRRRCGS